MKATTKQQNGAKQPLDGAVQRTAGRDHLMPAQLAVASGQGWTVPRKIFLLAVACWLGCPRANADVIIDWNEQMLRALQAESTPATNGSRTATIVHAAMYDAVNSILRTHEPYRFDLPPALPGALPEAAALAAAYHTMKALCPSRVAVFTAAYEQTVASLPDGPEREEGLRIGAAIATLILDARAADGSSTQVTYIPESSPGAWRRTPPDFRPPLDPQWGFVRPFVIPAVDNFPMRPPPALNSAEYAAAYELTKSKGVLTGGSRLEEETRIGIYWAYDRGRMGPPTIIYNRIVQAVAAQRHNTLAENARLFALTNMAQTDAGIVCWAVKYRYNHWRPVTAIRAGDTDGNEATNADSAWTPLGCPGGLLPNFTPPFPAYPSGHSMFGSAAFQVLRRFYGTDAIAFETPSEELPGEPPRHFKNISHADEENTMSRIYLGVHWIYDQREGQRAGWSVGDYVFFNALRPLAAKPTLDSYMLLPDGNLALHVSAPLNQRWQVKQSENLSSWSESFSGQGPATLLDPANAAARFFLVVPAP